MACLEALEYTVDILIECLRCASAVVSFDGRVGKGVRGGEGEAYKYTSITGMEKR